MLCGGSSGSAMVGVLKAARQLGKGQRCVVLLPDSVRNYMSKFLSDDWMIDNGFTSSKVLVTPGMSQAQQEWWESRCCPDPSSPQRMVPSTDA